MCHEPTLALGAERCEATFGITDVMLLPEANAMTSEATHSKLPLELCLEVIEAVSDIMLPPELKEVISSITGHAHAGALLLRLMRQSLMPCFSWSSKK